MQVWKEEFRQLCEMMFTAKNDGWLRSMQDPFREKILETGTPDLNMMLELLPRPNVNHGFDPILIKSNMERLETTPKVNLGHPLLDLSVKTGLAHIDATFQGDHPKYGLGYYGRSTVDAFPPTIVAAVDALSGWGIDKRAVQLWSYWVLNMISNTGMIKYRAPSLSEYGHILSTAALLLERSGIEDWLIDGFKPLDDLAEYVLGLIDEARKEGHQLVSGSGDEDMHSMGRRYFHANAWLARGLKKWATLCERASLVPKTPIASIHERSELLENDILESVRVTWPEDPEDWWLQPCVEAIERPNSLTDTRIASYTNYRYYPELLSSKILPPELANRVVDARLNGGGQFCGMTRFMDWTDDWPLAEYLSGLWAINRKEDFLLSLYGHVAYQQDKESLTACEQLTFPPGQSVAPYCLPSQLVAARAGRLLNLDS